MKNKDRFFMDIAMRCAEQSYCISLHVGAVLVRDGKIISTGYNGTPKGAANCDKLFDWSNPSRLNRDQHHEWSKKHEIHAEMNAILQAAKFGISTDGCTIYVTHEPCDDCLKNMIQAGIKEVVFNSPYKSSCCSSTYRNNSLIKIRAYGN